MIEKYEIPTDEELQGMNQDEFLLHTTQLLAEAKRLQEVVSALEQGLRGSLISYDSVVESVVEFYGESSDEWKELNGLGDEEE
jgi:hypothetical protein